RRVIARGISVKVLRIDGKQATATAIKRVAIVQVAMQHDGITRVRPQLPGECGTAPQQCELGQGTAAHRASGAAGSALPYSSRQHDAATRRRCTTLWWPADPSLRTAARRVCVREQHAQATGHAYRR